MFKEIEEKCNMQAEKQLLGFLKMKIEIKNSKEILIV